MNRLRFITLVLIAMVLMCQVAVAKEPNFSYVNTIIDSNGVISYDGIQRDATNEELAVVANMYSEALNSGINVKKQYNNLIKLLLTRADNFKIEGNSSGNSDDSTSQNGTTLCITDSSEGDVHSDLFEVKDTKFEAAYLFRALAGAIGKVEPELSNRADSYVYQVFTKKLLPYLEIYREQKITEIYGIKIPTWLIDSRSDTTSIYILGMLDYVKSHKDANFIELIKAQSEGIVAFAVAAQDEFPYGAHYESMQSPYTISLAHNRQIAALATAGKLLDNTDFIRSAEFAVDNLYLYLLSSYGPITCLGPAPVISTQYPAAVATITENIATLAKVTGKKNYATLAGVAASWFYSNNPSGRNIFDPDSGRCYEYVSEGKLSKSTSPIASAEAILTTLIAEKLNVANYMHVSELTPPHCFQIIETENGQPVRKDYEIQDITYPQGIKGKITAIKRENSFWLKLNITEEDTYSFHLVYLKQRGFAVGTSILVRIDGDKIYTVPLGGSTDKSYMVMQEILEPRTLQVGLHSLGIKFSGLLLGTPARIDSIIIQPKIQNRIMIEPSGRVVALIKNFYSSSRAFDLAKFPNVKFSKIIRQNGTEEAVGSVVTIPAASYIILEGNRK